MVDSGWLGSTAPKSRRLPSEESRPEIVANFRRKFVEGAIVRYISGKLLSHSAEVVQCLPLEWSAGACAQRGECRGYESTSSDPGVSLSYGAKARMLTEVSQVLSSQLLLFG